jgi:hypothetical protein
MLGNLLRIAEGHYTLTVQDLGLTFDVNYLRRERRELNGELTVRCTLAGAHTVDGILSSADFNLSSLRARNERAKHLAERAHTQQIDWIGLLEETCLRVLSEEREGSPEIALDDIPEAKGSDTWWAGDLPVLSRHPIIWFGDGGAAKSYLALYLAKHLAMEGHQVLYCDWEFAGEDHRDRWVRLCGPVRPVIWYLKCDKPMVEERERIARTVDKRHIDYVICDSVAFAANGPPEAADVAAAYFRAVRSLGIGSLHIAHVTKSEEHGEKKPFGSIFYHNSARATWFLKRAEESDRPDEVTVGMMNRKANIGRLNPPIGFKFLFGHDRTTVVRAEVRDNAELSKKLPIWERMKAAVARGALTADQLADELDEKASSIAREATRRDRTFMKLPDGRIGLVSRHG